MGKKLTHPFAFSYYVSHGTYGCVMKPAYMCPNSNMASTSTGPPRYAIPMTVAKLFSKPRYYNDELESDKWVKRIDPSGEFTLTSKNHCKIPSNFYSSIETNKCRGHTFPSPEYPQIIYPDGGHDLFIEAQQGNSANFEQIFVAMDPVFKGLHKLQTMKVVHQDIKPTNIVYDRLANTCKLIDFGIMEDRSNVFSRKNMGIMQHKYMYYPPEYQLFSGSNNNVINLSRFSPSHGLQAFDNSQAAHASQASTTIMKHVLTNRNSMEQDVLKRYGSNLFDFSPLVRDTYNSGLFDMRNKLGALKDTVDMIESFKTNQVKTLSAASLTVDVYMLGVTLLQILLIKLHKQHFDATNAEFYTCVLHLIADMTHMNCMKRLTPHRAYQRYKECCKLLSHNKKQKRKRSPQPSNPPPVKSKSRSSSVQIVKTVKGRTPSIEVVRVK